MTILSSLDYKVFDLKNQTVGSYSSLQGGEYDETFTAKCVVKKRENYYYFNVFIKTMYPALELEIDDWQIEIVRIVENGDLLRLSSIPSETTGESFIEFFSENNIQFEKLDSDQFILNPTDEQFDVLIKQPFLFNTFTLHKINNDDNFYKNLKFVLAGILGIFVIAALLFYSKKVKNYNGDRHLKETVQKLVAQAKLKNAILMLKKECKSKYLLKKISIIEFNYKNASQKYSIGTLTSEEFKKEEALIAKSLLELFDDIKLDN